MSLEDTLIDWIKERSGQSDLLTLGIGDDAAVIEPTEESLVTTTDMLIEGVHFEGDTEPERVGWKALARPISDMAAMAARPLYAMIAIAMGREVGDPLKYFKRLYTGVLQLAGKFKMPIIGGDLTRSLGHTSLCVTVIGESFSKPPVSRKGAKVTDKIFVTGELGGSILGRHLDFRPRVMEAIILNQKYRLNAMIDISDGLARDISRICEASGVGAVLYEDKIPVSQSAHKMSTRSLNSPLQHALYDGEDYELILVVPDFEAESILNHLPFGKPKLTEIGHIATRGLRLKRENGSMVDLAPAGWDSLESPYE